MNYLPMYMVFRVNSDIKNFNKAFVIVPAALGRFQRPTILAL